MRVTVYSLCAARPSGQLLPQLASSTAVPCDPRLHMPAANVLPWAVASSVRHSACTPLVGTAPAAPAPSADHPCGDIEEQGGECEGYIACYLPASTYFDCPARPVSVSAPLCQHQQAAFADTAAPERCVIHCNQLRLCARESDEALRPALPADSPTCEVKSPAGDTLGAVLGSV